MCRTATVIASCRGTTGDIPAGFPVGRHPRLAGIRVDSIQRDCFCNPILLKAGETAIASTAWQSDLELAAGTVYYWRVRAVGDGTTSAWSATRAFTTAPAANPQTPFTTPDPVSTSSLPEPTVSPEQGTLSENTPSSIPTATSSAGEPYWAKWIIYFGVALVVIAIIGVTALIILTRKIGRR